MNNDFKPIKLTAVALGVGVALSFSTSHGALTPMSGPFSSPEWFGQANYLYSPLPEICDGVTDTTTSGGHCTNSSPAGALAGGLLKFVDSLPLLSVGCTTAGTGGTNNLGQCLSVATPDKTTFAKKIMTDNTGNTLNLPNTDYYSIELVEYSKLMHSDMGAPTPLRGYHQLATPGNSSPSAAQPQYLSPFIIAAKGLPTRLKFKNSIAHEIPLPVDQSYWGAGSIDYNGQNQTPNATPMVASTMRANLHLHGGDTPWISDGTPHTWTAATGDATGGTGPGFSKGLSFQNVPDMVTNGWLLAGNTCAQSGLTTGECINPTTTDGLASYYYPNGQSSRLMFYHDHSYGITRLNVYMGEAGGYLLADKAQEDSLHGMGLPGWIAVDKDISNNITGVNLGNSDIAHLIPMVIQDKTFVPDNGEDGGQTALQDPTWPAPSNALAATDYSGPLPYWTTTGGSATDGWGKGSLWLPHVYVTNQLPMAVSQDMAGNPIVPSTIAPLGRWDYTPWMGAPLQINMPPVDCTTTAYPIPFSCPAMKNPMAVPESFMDTIVVNGTVYPHVNVYPSAYRFKMLNAADDRFFNLGLYVAVTQDPNVTIVDTTPATPGMGASADATITAGHVASFLITSPGSGYPMSPQVPLVGGSGIGAVAYATVDTTGAILKYVVDPAGTGTGYAIGDPLTIGTDAATYTVATGNCTTTATTGCAITGLTQIIAPTTIGQPINPMVVKLNYGLEPVDYAGLGITEAKGLATVDSTGAVIDLMVDPANTGLNYIAGGTSCENVANSLVPLCTEVKQVYPTVYTTHTTPQLCSGSNASAVTVDNMGLTHVANLNLGRTGMAPKCWPANWPSDGSAHSGVVPDPFYAGPPIIQIGNEGGLLPNPVIIPSTPISYQYNRKVATVLGFTAGHGLDMSPAQRTDVVMDFHSFAPATPGNTTVLIAYNDHPAPAPLFDSRYDMYTGDLDQSSGGGAPSTLPGYGPNTRTLMQIRVAGNDPLPNSPVNIAAIQSTSTGIPALFASTQDPIIVPEPQYPQNGLAPGSPGNGYAPTATAGTFYTVQLPNSDAGVLGGITVTAGGKYAEKPTVTIAAPTGINAPVQATASANLVGGPVNALYLSSGGSGYTSPPTITVTSTTPGVGTGASFTANLTATSLTSATLATPGSGYGTGLSTINWIKDGAKAAIACTGCGTVSYGVNNINITNAGLYAGYTGASAPTLSFSGGGGTGAAATATLGTTGGITKVVPAATKFCGIVTTTGRAVTFVKAGGGGTSATATANISNGVITAINVTAPGSGYAQTGTTFTIAGCTNPTGTITIGRPITAVTLTATGTGYTAAPAVATSALVAGTGGSLATLTSTVSGYLSAVNQTNIIAAIGTNTTSSTLSLPSASPTPNGQVPGTVAVVRAPSAVIGYTKVSGGIGYTTTPTITVTSTTPGVGTGAVFKAQMTQRQIASFSLTNPGNGYVDTVPAVAITPVLATAAGSYNTGDGGGAGAAYYNPTVVDFKGIIEGFDPIWGTLNVELADSIPAPGTAVSQNYLVAAAMPFGYVDPPSELITDGAVADWRIDHIGVDAHALHFHLFNVQIVNYLDVAGQIYMPDSNQLGWNEVLRSEPFTSVFVALRPKKMALPWELPLSIRALDPTTYLGAVNGPVTCINNPFALQALVGPVCVPFTQVDPTANAVNITNALVNFGSEYVYHCHLLSHEEHDMMRPISFILPPKNAPGLVRTNATTLTITDNSFNETDFIIEKSTDSGSTWAQFASVQTGKGSTTSIGVKGTTIVTGAATGTNVLYRAKAANIVGCNASVPALIDSALPATAAPACSDIFTGWPSVTAFSPASTGSGVP